MSSALADLLGPAQPTPDTPSSIPKNTSPRSAVSRKRKRDSNKPVAVTFRDIHIRPYPGSIYDKPFLLRPLQLVPRFRLPLSFLDTSAANVAISPSRLFTARIEVLEPGKEGQSDALVLIASVGSGDELYAIERVKPGVHTLCKLCAWVQLSNLEDGSAAVLQHVHAPAPENARGKWWDNAVVSPLEQPANIVTKRLKLSMAPPSIPVGVVPAQETGLAEPATISEGLPMADGTFVAPPIDVPKPSEEVFETLIRQYLEALYISKTSLAFFAKGPLSRTRNTFTTNNNATAISDLTAQLRNMLLSMTAMDKKYKEKLPDTIKSFPAQSLSEDEEEVPVTNKKRRSKKIPKLSREGYYPIEEEYCRRWWLNNQSNNARARPEETFEQLLRRRVGDLRRRETLAQITLILEILALEASPDFFAAEAQPELQVEETQVEQGVDSQALTNGGSVAAKKPKRKVKKQQDLDLLLDLLLDKLSIWQSIEQDLGAAIDADKKRNTLAENSEKLQEQDILVSFCTDVVIPFYKSRIPKQAALVNKKLGGPGAVSPAKTEKLKSHDIEKGAARHGGRHTRKPLQKTLSDTNGFIRSRPPSLSRSATDSQGIPRLKREASELSLLDIPLARPAHRDSFSQLRHLQQRQVDLTAISAATDAKLKQKAKIEQDLKEAINTLKRPNRGQAVRELADASDQRSLGSASMRKKTMGPVRKVLQNVRNIQVTATPKHKRAFNAMATARMEQEEEPEEQHAPSSGDFCIPSSGFRGSNADLVGATPAVPRSKPLDGGFAISATPSRKSLQTVSQDDLPTDELGITPLKMSATSKLSFDKGDRSSAQQGLSFQDFMRSQMSRSKAPVTPMKSGSKRVSLEASSSVPAAIFATPIRPSSSKPLMLENVTENTPLKAATLVPSANHGGEEQSIYDALGWNDYDDELA